MTPSAQFRGIGPVKAVVKVAVTAVVMVVEGVTSIMGSIVPWLKYSYPYGSTI